ncbi:hypothetical protein M885DRAFT_170838 [Pelagophyceae sp. CCMP2097]|nr:hypothetical protein M885DRAFT_170838 [Pelagophyceae sp. CCMP2097]
MSRAEIDEIDALLRASELARTKVGERARKLYEEHDAVLSAMDRDLDVDKLAPARAVRARPGKDVPSAQHALLFHLAEGHAGATDAYAERQSKVPASAPPRAAPPPPEDAVVPKAPAYATPAEAKEWDEYYRFCARGALFSALDRGRETELELAQRLSAEVLGANDVDDWDDANVLAARRRRRAMENDVDKARRRQVADVTARFLAYEPRKTPVHGLEGKLRDCGLDLPSPADIVARAEADFLASRGLGPAALGATFLGSECGDAEPESSPKAAKKSKKLRAADAEARQQQKAADAEADRAARDARYRKATGVTEVEEMHAALARDAYVAVPMQRLPAAAGGGAVSAVVRGSTVRVDVAFPALEAYRRAEHDVAAYFMPSYTAHLSEPRAPPPPRRSTAPTRTP